MPETLTKVYSGQSEYKGKPVLNISLDDNSRFPFSFGAKKAELMLLALPEIIAFVNACGDPTVVRVAKDRFREATETV